ESTPYIEPVRLQHSATFKARRFDRSSKPIGPLTEAHYEIRGNTLYALADRPPTTGLNVPLEPARLPALLSQTGLFATLSDLTPRPGVIPYDVCSPLWSDGARKRRWVVLPGGERIGYSPKSEWSFPRGTILVKHFELPDDPDRPEQTRWL